jgi:hypothetical protein
MPFCLCSDNSPSFFSVASSTRSSLSFVMTKPSGSWGIHQFFVEERIRIASTLQTRHRPNQKSIRITRPGLSLPMIKFVVSEGCHGPIYRVRFIHELAEGLRSRGAVRKVPVHDRAEGVRHSRSSPSSRLTSHREGHHGRTDAVHDPVLRRTHAVTGNTVG